MSEQRISLLGAPLRYNRFGRGDFIEGTKQQLQALGIGCGLSFPGEPGGPKRDLKTTDPRGFRVEVSNRYREQGTFGARVMFPGRPEYPGPSSMRDAEAWLPFAEGVKVCHTASEWCDEYVGTADALVAASLVPVGHFPGLPGMRKTSVTIYADGTTPVFPVHAVNTKRTSEPGARTIVKLAGDRFKVSVCLSKDESEARGRRMRAASDEWERQIAMLPRPPSLLEFMAPRLALEAAKRSEPDRRAPAIRHLALVATSQRAPMHLVASATTKPTARPTLRLV